MERLSSVDMECVKAARFYHAPGITLCSADLGFAPTFEINRYRCHIAGNKGARSATARSNVTIVVNCSMSSREASQYDRQTPAFMR